jgi:hypothetical protein
MIEADLFTLVVKEPLFARLANELLESFSCGVLEYWPFEFGPYASSFSETSDCGCHTVRGRISARTEGRAGEEGERISLGRNRRGGV